jgi:hypothetical protein
MTSTADVKKSSLIERHRQDAISDAKRSKGFVGKDFLITHLEGGKLTVGEALKAKCFDCMGYFADGRGDCKDILCPLYPWMPYKGMEETESESLAVD